MMSGFIKLQRQIQGTWIHKNPVYFKAYCDIIFNVNWKPEKTIIKGKELFCGVGESLKSLESWAYVFGKGWDKSKVRRFFKRLETQHLIRTKSDTVTTRLTLLNTGLYEEQQNEKRTKPDTKSEPNPTPIEEGRKKNEEVNKGYVDSSESTPPDILFFLQVAGYFKKVTGKNIKIGNTHSKIMRSDKYKRISARMVEGATIEDCKKVIDLKYNEWKDDSKMKQYIQIPTLFAKSNFEKYLDEAENENHVSISDYEFPYKLPTFSNSDERWRFFLNRFNQYKPEINRQEYNSLRKRALNGKEAEQVCKELETKYEHLSKIELQWQHTT